MNPYGATDVKFHHNPLIWFTALTSIRGTYDFEKPLELSQAITCSVFESKVSGTWLPDDRSTRNFLMGGWLLLAVIISSSSLVTSSITAAHKEARSRHQRIVWELLSVTLKSVCFCSLTFVLGSTFVEAVSRAQWTRRWRPVALLHTYGLVCEKFVKLYLTWWWA